MKGQILALVTFTFLVVPITFIINSKYLTTRAFLKTLYDKVETEYVNRVQMNFYTILLYSPIDAVYDYVHFEKSDVPIITIEELNKEPKYDVRWHKVSYVHGTIRDYISYNTISALRTFLWFYNNRTDSTVLLVFDSYAYKRYITGGVMHEVKDYIAYPSSVMYEAFYGHNETLRKNIYIRSSTDIRILLSYIPLRFFERGSTTHLGEEENEFIKVMRKLVAWFLQGLEDPQYEFIKNSIYQNNFWVSSVELVPMKKEENLLGLLVLKVDILNQKVPFLSSFELVTKGLQTEEYYIISGPIPVLSMWYLRGPLSYVYGFANSFPSVRVVLPIKVLMFKI